MKKKKFLAIILIAGGAFLGTGYSWWGEGLQVNGNISTGEFKVVPAEGKVKTGDKIKKEEKLDATGFYYKIKCLIPSQSYSFCARFENQGNIPAQVSEVIMDKTVKKEPKDKKNNKYCSEEIFNFLKVTGTVKKVTAKGEITCDSSKGYKNIFTIKADEKITISNLNTYLSEKLKTWKLEPGESIIFDDFKIKLEIPKENSSQNSIEEHQFEKEPCNSFERIEVDFNLKVMFKQHNQV